MVNMEIDIKIRLEDADIGLLIKSLFEIIKRIPQDNININIDPNAKPPTQENPISEILTNTHDDKVYHKNIATTDTTDFDPDINTVPDDPPLINTSEPLYYSNGSSVKKIDSEKKNEEN